MASDPDQEYIHFMGSETLPSACYILSDESSIPFYSTRGSIVCTELSDFRLKTKYKNCKILFHLSLLPSMFTENEMYYFAINYTSLQKKKTTKYAKKVTLFFR